MVGWEGRDSKQPAKSVDTVTAVLGMRSEGDERARRWLSWLLSVFPTERALGNDQGPLRSQTHFSSFSPRTLFLR